MKTVMGFTDFRDNERVVAIVRHHWWVFVREALLLTGFFIAPFFLVPLVYSFAAASGMAPSIPGGVAFFFASFWTLIIWNVAFARWTDYYYDMWVITNWRIINIDQQGFFKRSVSTLLSLDRIEDIETESSGVVGNLLNYGHVQVQTSAHEEAFNISEVPNPAGVEGFIRAAQEEKQRVFSTPSQ